MATDTGTPDARTPRLVAGFASPSCHGDHCGVPGPAHSLPTVLARALRFSLIGGRGFEPGQFFRPAHLAVDAAGFYKKQDR